MRPIARWAAMPMLAAPFGAWALGLGDIELRSALNQPFSADIVLVSATPEELAGLRVELAPVDTFQRYGLERPAFLSNLDFTVARDERGRDVIRVSSRQSISEPFVTLLIEASWARGRLLREYTVLLDPPVLLPSPTMPAGVQPAGSGVQPGVAGIDRPQPAPTAPAQPPASAPAPAATPAATVAQPGTASGSYGPVQRAETLWSIASGLQPQGVTLNQMMVALYQANPEAFDGNMNLLRVGAVLRIPSASEVGALSAAAASEEFRRQLTTWQGSAEQQARLRLVSPDDSAAVPAAGTGASAGAGGATTADAAERARLESELASARAELEESRRLLQLRNQELLDLQTRLGAVEDAAAAAAAPAVTTDSAAAAAAGVDLESEPLFADEVESAAVAASTDAAGQSAAPETAAVPTTPPPAAAVAVPAAAAPSLMSRLLGLLAAPLLWIGLGVAALLGAAVWFLRSRREEDEVEARDDVEDSTGRWGSLDAGHADTTVEEPGVATARLRTPARDDDGFVVEEQRPAARGRSGERGAAAAVAAGAGAAALAGRDAGDAKQAASAGSDDDTLSSQTVINLDETDVLAEADFHLAYGLYDQAADLVSQAITQHPQRLDLKLKLLEVFFVWGNRDGFMDAARSLHEQLGDGAGAEWDKVAIMGRQLCPGEELFRQSAGASGDLDMALEPGEDAALDFTFEDQQDNEADMDLEVGDDEDYAARSGIEFLLDDDLQAETVASPDQVSFDADDELTRTTTGDEPGDEPTESALWGGSRDDTSLDVGATTAAGLEAALLDDDGERDDGDDTAARTTPDIDGLAETQESLTQRADRAYAAFGDDDATEETPRPDTRSDSPTMETPTVEMVGPDAPTVETPGPQDLASGTYQIDDMAESTGASRIDYTAEINLDDLGLDVTDLERLPDNFADAQPDSAEAGTMADAGETAEIPTDDAGRDDRLTDFGSVEEADTREQPGMHTAEDALLSAAGIDEVLGSEDELGEHQTSVLDGDELPQFDEDPLSGTEVLPSRFEYDEQTGSTSLMRALHSGDGGNGEPAGGGLDLDLDDLSAALDAGDTVEQPRAAEFSAGMFDGNGYTSLDLDIGADIIGSDDPTGTEGFGAPEGDLMTEVGTKLDLARAYIDMGDPDGARSILEEVLDEGNAGQRREAQELMQALSA